MPISQFRFETALLDVLKGAVGNGRHIDAAIDDYLAVENIDDDDPGLWSDLHHGCHRFYHLIVAESQRPLPEALKLLARLGVLRDLHGGASEEWFGDGEPSRSDIAIRNFLHTLRQSAPEEGLRLWRLYTVPKVLLNREVCPSIAVAAAQTFRLLSACLAE